MYKKSVASASISALLVKDMGRLLPMAEQIYPCIIRFPGGLSMIGTSYEIEQDAIVPAQQNVDTEERLARLRELVG